jgi:hypothetical protein
MTKDKYFTILIYALIIIGYIICFAFSFTKHPGSVTAGYSCLVAGLFMLMISQMIIQVRDKLPELTGLQQLQILPIPEMTVLAIIIWLLTINVKYSKKIKEDRVTNEYSVFNSISLILLLLQLILLYKNDVQYRTMLIFLIASFQAITIFISQLNLEYFITDG